jgi:hypothetical protein
MKGDRSDYRYIPIQLIVSTERYWMESDVDEIGQSMRIKVGNGSILRCIETEAAVRWLSRYYIQCLSLVGNGRRRMLLFKV